jgi:hypothetical protein
MKYRLMVFVLGVTLLFVGCIKSIDSSGKTTYAFDPNKGMAVQKGLDVAAGTATGVSAVWPPAAIIGVILTGLAGVWRKTNPVLAAATSEQQKYYDVSASVVAAIEAFKDAAPTEYEKLKAELVKAVGPNAENVIRAIRNLPPKV